MNKQIFFMHSEKFVCQCAGDFTKELGISCYSFIGFSDFSYLIKDLKPTEFYVDFRSIKDNFDSFMSELGDCEGIKPHLILLNIFNDDLSEGMASTFDTVKNGAIELDSLFSEIES